LRGKPGLVAINHTRKRRYLQAFLHTIIIERGYVQPSQVVDVNDKDASGARPRVAKPGVRAERHGGPFDQSATVCAMMAA